MNHTSFAALLLVFASLGLVACSGDEPGADAKTGWAGIAEKAQAQIREEMATQNLDIGEPKAGVPRAALSPQGDLVIDGKKMDISAQQRARLLEYRGKLAGVAEAGADVGLQAAALATDAMKEAAKAALSGDKTSIEERMKPQADAIKVAAQALCDRLPALLNAQRAAAEAVPEFRPYATMDEKDIAECSVDDKVAAP